MAGSQGTANLWVLGGLQVRSGGVAATQKSHPEPASHGRRQAIMHCQKVQGTTMRRVRDLPLWDSRG